ncbi:MAG: ABC transporter substrate-binding protein [Candidatus Methylomirabilota bacterium]|jgi:polar amino acid transport system substrate-binding protein
MPPAPADAIRELAPTGKLRAAINFGNPVLAQRDPATGEPRGATAALARELARRLGVPIEFVPYDAAGQVTAAARSGVWDIAFLAIDPARAVDIAFTPPYVLIEGTYLVRDESPLRAIDEFDREGVRIAVGDGSAYHLYLKRTLKKATLVAVRTSSDNVNYFLAERLEAAAGAKQPLVRFAAENPGVRVIEGRFMVIEQAMGTPQGRPEGARYLREYIEEMKASGFVARELERSGQTDAVVAPPAR